MGLDKIFQKQEKVEEEKTLETAATDSSTIDSLLSYFNSSFGFSFKSDMLEDWKMLFEEYLKDLQGYQIMPNLIEKINSNKNSHLRLYSLSGRIKTGLFLSALIQTSYNQGFNNFKFEKIKADGFGAFLKGTNKHSIKIKVETIDGDFLLNHSKNCCLKYNKLNGSFPFYFAENCQTRIFIKRKKKKAYKQSF